MLNKQMLENFYWKNLKILEVNGYCFPTSNNAFSIFKANCQNIIESFEKPFPCDCAQLYQLLLLLEGNGISPKLCTIMMMKIVDSMHDKFDQVYKSPKLFISHATSDKTIIEKFVTMLEQIGVNHHQLFCSSINAYGIPQGAGNIYDYIQNEMSNDNLFVIMMLSQNYYDSYMCLNEMGAAWIKKSKYQSILLPGFNFPDIQGAIDPRDICFKLDDPENRNYALNDLKDRITEHLELEPVKSSLWERFRDKFTEEIDNI